MSQRPNMNANRNMNVPALLPNPVVEIGKPLQLSGGKIVRTDVLANGDKISTRMDVDPRYLRQVRGRGNGG